MDCITNVIQAILTTAPDEEKKKKVEFWIGETKLERDK